MNCSYCGRENDATATRCCECGTDFAKPAAAVPLVENVPPPTQYLDITTISGALDYAEGYHRPDWELIWKTICDRVAECDRSAAWNEAALQWVHRLREDLGGDYHVCTSENFVLLCELEQKVSQRLLDFSERSLSAILGALPHVAWDDEFTREAILIFSEEDDYFEYILYFYPEGVHPNSIGVFLRSGFPHVAVRYVAELEAAQTIAHELTHQSLAHLPIPVWLNEGLAVSIDRLVGRSHVPVMESELAERHAAFWNETNIQSFWAGTSWGDAGDDLELSYSLGEVLVQLLKDDRDAFLAFVSRAHYDDAGQTAALDCLGINLGDAVATFLGPGNWRPYRKAMVDLWEQRGKNAK